MTQKKLTFKKSKTKYYFEECEPWQLDLIEIALIDGESLWIRNEEGEKIGVYTQDPDLMKRIEWLVGSVLFNIEEGHRWLYEKPTIENGIAIPSLTHICLDSSLEDE